MAKRNKLQKFAELLHFPNVYENFDLARPGLVGPDGEPIDLKGRWGIGHFGNDRPITLELACGRGEYTLGLARMFPERNFIGIDIKGARIWKGARLALEGKISNTAFLRTRIEQIAMFFAPGEVSEIWVTFPDPFLKGTKANRRLTSPGFLDQYRQVLRPGGLVHLKTDSPELYEYTLEALPGYPYATLLYQDDDIYAKPLPMTELQLKTHYERMHLAEGRKIKYVRFGLG